MAVHYINNPAQLVQFAERQLNLGAWAYNLRTKELTLSPMLRRLYAMEDGQIEHYPSTQVRIHPDDRKYVGTTIEAAMAGGQPFSIQHRLLQASGEVDWLLVTGEPVPEEPGLWMGFIQEITERVQAEQQRAELSSRLEETLEHISDAFFTLDKNWCFSYVNSRSAEVLGHTRKSLLGRDIWAAFPEAEGSEFQRAYQHTMATGETTRFTAWYGGELQTWFQATAHRVPEGLAVYFRDVSTERAREEALRVAEERFRLLARATHDVVWDWDLQNNSVWWNENLHTRFGHPPESVEPGPESWSSRLHPDDREAVLASIHAAMNREDNDRWEMRYRFMHGNGSILQVVDRGFVIRDEQGRPIRMLGSMIDITAQRELEERAHQTRKMEAVGQLTGGVAHDFNNLLTVMIGNAEILADQLPASSPLRSLAEMILGAAERGAELTSRLLAFARRQALEPKVIRLDGQIDGMWALLRRTLSAAIDIDVVTAGDLWHAEVDPGQLEVAVLNLALNARDAMPEGGRLTLETANAWLDEDYAALHPGVVPGAYVQLSVSDSGTGMAPDVVARAFEPFFTTKGPGQGTGLGLSMVFGFVKQSGAHIKVYSEPGEGTSIKLYFPRSGAAEETPGDTSGARAPRGSEHILVVEDDELVRTHLVTQLQALGYLVSSAADGPDALAQLDALPDIDLLLTDIIMPGGMNGRELAERVQALRPAMRVLYTSGYTENAIVHHGRLDPGVRLLGKPYRRQELADKVRNALDDN